ncbi:MAG: helix-turn-helix transcriptional regulator [Candidatus Rokuibacteriota bacterium]
MAHVTSTRQLLTAVEAAAKLGVGRRTVLRLVHSGDLPYVRKLDGRAGAFLFDPDVVDVVARRKATA